MTGAAGTTSAPTATSGSWTARQRRPVHRPGGQQRRRGQRRPASSRWRREAVFIRVEGDAPPGALATPPPRRPPPCPPRPRRRRRPRPSTLGRVRGRRAAGKVAAAAEAAEARRARGCSSRPSAPEQAQPAPQRLRRRLPSRRPRRGRRRLRRDPPSTRATTRRRSRSPPGWPAEAKKRGLPPQLPGHGRARRVQPHERQLRRRRLARLLPDARLDLGTRLPRLRQGPEQADRLVPRHRRTRQGTTRQPRPIDHDPSQFGEWIADTEHPAEQYRGRYQLRLDEANSCSRTRRSAAPARRSPRRPRRRSADAAARRRRRPPARAQGAGPKALAALKEAEKYTGTPYKWGGSTPQTGFDCSGLVQWAYAQAGVQIPRVTDEQIEAANGTDGAPRRAAAGRPRVLPRPERLRPPRRDLDGRRQVPARAAHRRRRQGLQPRRAVLQGPVHRRPPLRRARPPPPPRPPRRRGGRAAAARRSTRSPSPPPRPRSRATPPRRADAGSGLFKAIGAQEARNHRRAAATARWRRRPARPPERARRLGLFLRRSRPSRRREAKAAAEAPAAPAAPAAARGAGRARPRRRPGAPAARRRPSRATGPPPDLSAVPADYPGDDAGQEALAKWLAKRPRRPDCRPSCP